MNKVDFLENPVDFSPQYLTVSISETLKLKQVVIRMEAGRSMGQNGDQWFGEKQNWTFHGESKDIYIYIYCMCSIQIYIDTDIIYTYI